ncbi:MAG: hypothetical protein VX444_03965 [Pseudomonadota bacterium]|nr:hypothetical protein [Pseudomonadota bacterium]
MKGLLKPIGLAFALLLAAEMTQAQTQRHCAPRETVVERLADSYGETRQSVGLGRDNALMEVYASVESGTWTITVTTPTGMTCLIASGQSFETFAEKLPLSDKDA